MARRKKKGGRIGFVDLDLNNFHANVYLKHLRGGLKSRGFSVAGAWALKEKPSRRWAGENDVPWFDTPEALDEAVDHYMILAPGAPEVHLDLAKKILPFGKTTYIDKTFADSHAAAKKIFALADKHRVAVQTTSALRYTNIQQWAAETGSPVKHVVTWGSGRSFGEYAIHPVEMAISLLGPKAVSVQRRGTGKYSQLLVNFTGDRTATIHVFLNSTPFAAAITTAKETKLLPVEGCDIFYNMQDAILRLFETGKADIDRKESLLIRRILDKADDPKALRGPVKL